MSRIDRMPLIERLQKLRGSRLLCYLTSDRPNANAHVQKDVMAIAYQHLLAMGDTDHLDVLLFTLGGDTLAAFGITRMLRQFARRITVLVPHRCHSAGTLMALGADDILMTRLATLSPIDPSLIRPLNPMVEVQPGRTAPIPVSVESVAGFKSLVEDEWDMKSEGSRLAAFKLLAERVHPLALGDVYRSREQIQALARKLLFTHRSDEDAIRRIVSVLTQELGSHDYLISRDEARELLGQQIGALASETEGLLWKLFEDFASEMMLGVEYNAALTYHAGRLAAGVFTGGPVPDVQTLAIVESVAGGTHALEREAQISSMPIQMPVPGVAQGTIVGTGTSEEVVRQGWRHYGDDEARC